MTEYISKERAQDLIVTAAQGNSSRLACMLGKLEDEPPDDVVPVVHGKWLTPKALIECSECGFGMFPDAYYFNRGECTHHNESWFRPNYCPQCGARMDGGESGD